MEAEQRRTVALTQRQQRIEARALRLLVAQVRSQQRAQLADCRSDHHPAPASPAAPARG